MYTNRRLSILWWPARNRYQFNSWYPSLLVTIPKLSSDFDSKVAKFWRVYDVTVLNSDPPTSNHWGRAQTKTQIQKDSHRKKLLENNTITIQQLMLQSSGISAFNYRRSFCENGAVCEDSCMWVRLKEGNDKHHLSSAVWDTVFKIVFLPAKSMKWLEILHLLSHIVT